MVARVGVDVGGTFTDLYCESESAPATVLKVPTTREDPSLGVLHALEAAGIEPSEVDGILHGTTIATNTIIERTGARCALVTTAGFRDILELGRRDRPTAYGLSGLQAPLIPRDQRFEVPGRMDCHGNELTPLGTSELTKLATVLRDGDYETVVVSFLHSYANPAHERRAGDLLREINPDWNIVLSCEVLREYYEFERTSTATIQGYLQPMVARYADGLAEKLGKWGYRRQVLVMQSNGGAVTLQRMGQRAANLVRSGPAAGVIAASRLGGLSGFDNVITSDMGGTSFDVAVVRGAKPTIADKTDLDFRVPLRLPMVDVHTIGAGGGSIAHVDRGRLLQVGPRSAGSHPGPVCLGRGGLEPTVTDANLLLGRIDSKRPIGGAGSEALDRDGSRAAFFRLGEPLGLGAEQAAAAVVDVVDQRMAGRIRLLSVVQGHDPRDFVMVAFGGAGPLHAASLIKAVGIRAVLVPTAPGVLCAQGCVLADVQYDLSKTVNLTTADLGPGDVATAFDAQIDEGVEQVRTDDAATTAIEVTHFVDMAYLGQIHTLRVPVEKQWRGAELAEAFRRQYRTEYGNELGDIGIVVQTLRTSVVGIRHDENEQVPAPRKRPAPEPSARRNVYFGQWCDTPIYWREQLVPGVTMVGPAVVEQSDTTTVIDPDMAARIDRFGNIIAEVT